MHACVFRGLPKNTWPLSIWMSGKWEKQGCILSPFKGSNATSQPLCSNTALSFLQVSSPYPKGSDLKHTQSNSALSLSGINSVDKHESKSLLHSTKLAVQIADRDGWIITLIHCQSKHEKKKPQNLKQNVKKKKYLQYLLFLSPPALWKEKFLNILS